MKRILITLVAATRLLAADATGKWTGTFQPTGQQSSTAYFVLKQDGTTLTGTAGPNPDQQHEIQHGKAEGSVVTFEVVAKTTMKFVLIQDGDDLNGDATGEHEGQQQTAKVALHRVR